MTNDALLKIITTAETELQYAREDVDLPLPTERYIAHAVGLLLAAKAILSEEEG